MILAEGAYDPPPKERKEKEMHDKIILPSSDQAASFQTVSGWVSRNGHFFGNDERLARYDGSTHRECPKCSKVIEKNNYCRDCHANGEIEKYQKMERREWNGTDGLYSQAHDKWFFGYDELSDYCEWNHVVSLDDLRLIICQPVYAREIDPLEFYESDLPEDGEVPSDLFAAFEELNKTIRESKIILSWVTGKYAAIIKK